jgi:hypothetical protein
MLFTRCNGEIYRDFGGIVLKCLQKPQPFSAFCELQELFSELIFRKSRDSLAYDNLTENSS